MDFLSDPIFDDIGRSDFVEGIDNELDFGHLEQFMQVAAAVGVGGIDESLAHSSLYAANNNNAGLQSERKGDTGQHMLHRQQHPPSTSSPIATISARVGLNATSHAATNPMHSVLPLTNGQNSQRTPQLPESPPDSSSEPPYSPLQEVHGLTLTSRELYNGLAALQDNADAFVAPNANSTAFYQQLQQHHADSSAGSVRIKHEAGNFNSTPVALDSTGGAPQLDLGGDNIMYTSSFLHYDGGDLYPNTTTPSYQSVGDASAAPTTTTTTTASCMITSMSEASRVQVIGTSPPTPLLTRASAPSTPVHSSSRKRKMSTQLDSPEFAPIKTDPGLIPASPTRPQALNEKLGSAPALPIVGRGGGDSTPTHSTASLSPAMSMMNSHTDNSLDGLTRPPTSGSADPSDPNALTPCIRFCPFQSQNWHKLCDQNLQELSVVYYRVDADKGFNFSVSDDAFVCQKKNHFQITCHARLQGDAKFVKTPSGLEKIKSFHLHFYGVKLEAPNQTIRVEQSQSDRSKKPFYPVPIDLQSHIVSKITVGRLHFSETTNNNMRKKGRPNPEQRYFQLVVGLHVHTMSGNFPVISQSSERIIVRASNPGQFESDVDLCWQRGVTQDSIFHMGRVGINTDRPDEGLVVHGNLKVSGHIVQPSDSRAKQEIGELDTSVQLRNLQKIRIVRYRYEPEFAVHSGLKRASDSDSEEIVDTGVIAQEVREVIPDAVKEGGSIVLPNGSVIENFLLVNKDRILMENIGAVKELCKVTGSLENRIEHLERMNSRLIRAKELDVRHAARDCGGKEEAALPDGFEACSNRSLQIIIFLLVTIMAACLAVVTTLYIFEYNKKVHKLREFEEFQMHLPHDLMPKGKLPQAEFPFLISSPRPPQLNGSAFRELNYSEQSGGQGGNDELTVVMEQPMVLEKPLPSVKEAPRSMATSAPPPSGRNNKTNGNKNKSKWPLPQEVLRVRDVLKEDFTKSASPSGEDSSSSSSSISENSSERPADAIPLSQDFENNSIDIDAQHITKNPLGLAGKLAAQHSKTGESTGGASAVTASNILKSNSAGDAPLASSNVSPQAAGKANGSVNLGSQLTYSVELPPISNKSQAVLESAIDNGDLLDLQNLSSNNESSDSPFEGYEFAGDVSGRDLTPERRSTSQRSVAWVVRRTVRVETFGSPAECTQKDRRGEISNCQSMCFEDSNQLPLLRVQPDERKHINVHKPQTVGLDENDKEDDDDDDVAVNKTKEDEEEDEDDDIDHKDQEKKPATATTLRRNASSVVETGKTSHATLATAKQVSSEQQSSESLDMEADILSGEPSNQKLAPHEPSITIEAPLGGDCWKVTADLVADNLNRTLNVDDFCPNIGKSLNVTFTIPLSKYLKETNFELQLTSAKPIKWYVCNQQLENGLKQRGKYLPAASGAVASHISMPTNVLQRRLNTSILFLNIPSRGYYERAFMLRASHLEDGVCDEKLPDANALLQYNIKFFRDCD